MFHRLFPARGWKLVDKSISMTALYSAVSSPIPRKGMETSRRQLRDTSFLRYTSFITYSPQGDGNTCKRLVGNAEFAAQSFIVYSPQGDGNLTWIRLYSFNVFLNVSSSIPRKGMETCPQGNDYCPCQWECFIVYSPQGDGNLNLIYIAYCVIPIGFIAYSPQGDGNLSMRIVPNTLAL